MSAKRIIQNITKHTPTVEELTSYARRKKNVMLYGSHGVGKTMKIKEVFTKLYGENWKIFNGTTMDPWTDLVGIPKEVDGHIEYIKPRFMGENLRAIFIDEYWRAKPQVRNACMELIQFKEINGVKFPNLEVVWGATNPPEGDGFTYDVEMENIDPAQLDRFHVHLYLDSNPDLSYFTKKFGHIGHNLVQWWTVQGSDAKALVSPRRLEMVGDICVENESLPIDQRIQLRTVLPLCSNVSALEANVYHHPVLVQFNDIIGEKKVSDRKIKMKQFINEKNNFDVAIKTVISNKDIWWVMDLVENHEFLDELFSRNPDVLKKIQDEPEKYPGSLRDYFGKKSPVDPKNMVSKGDVFSDRGLEVGKLFGKVEEPKETKAKGKS